MNYTFDHILNKEFKSVYKFLKEKYNISILQESIIADFINDNIIFLLSLKIWQKNLKNLYLEKNNYILYFQEMVSNILHTMILVPLEMNIPTLFTIRRTQELLLKFLYYYEHPIEFYKKEIDHKSKNIKNINELKDYIQTYPFSKKYKINDFEIKSFLISIMDDWNKQYQDLSNFVHASNSKYFQSVNYLNDFKIKKDDIKFIHEHLKRLSSISNTLFILFYFKNYINFEEYNEKSIIRSAIDNKLNYKIKIIDILKEI